MTLCSEIQFNPEGLRAVGEAAGFLKPLVHAHQTPEYGVTLQKSVVTYTRTLEL